VVSNSRRHSIEIPSHTISHKQTEINPWIKKMNEDTLIMEEKSFVAFICKIGNVATKQQRKSDLINQDNCRGLL